MQKVRFMSWKARSSKCCGYESASSCTPRVSLRRSRFPQSGVLVTSLCLLALASHGLASSSFETAKPGYEFAFPRDYFEHPAYAAEWWYYTGNLESADGRSFGFELTFFRAGIDRAAPPESAWDADQVYLAHFVVTDIAEGRIHYHERVNRRGPGLAGASEAERSIWNGNWNVQFLAGDPLRPMQRLSAIGSDASLRLELTPLKDVVVHGEDGVSVKAGGEGQASHYTSFTRLRASGSVVVGRDELEVRGLAWMDHEFFSHNLAENQAGWDWMSIQLDDGSDLMLYGMRGVDGRHDRFTGGTLVNLDGSQRHLMADDLRLIPGRLWRSGETGAAYPVEWRVEIPGLGLDLDVEPLLDAQEIVSGSGLTPVYWEGAVRYGGVRRGEPVKGQGYLEMTGYDRQVRLLR